MLQKNDWPHWKNDFKRFRGKDILTIPEVISKKVLSLRPPCRILRNGIISLRDVGRFTGIAEENGNKYVVFSPLNRPPRAGPSLAVPKDASKKALIFVKIDDNISVDIATEIDQERKQQ